MIALFIGLILGVLLGLYAGYRFTAAELEAAKKGQHIDYKQRWLEAVKLLQDEEKITPEQLKEITALPTSRCCSRSRRARVRMRRRTASNTAKPRWTR
jgi:hypothetical protein